MSSDRQQRYIKNPVKLNVASPDSMVKNNDFFSPPEDHRK